MSPYIVNLSSNLSRIWASLYRRRNHHPRVVRHCRPSEFMVIFALPHHHFPWGLGALSTSWWLELVSLIALGAQPNTIVSIVDRGWWLHHLLSIFFKYVTGLCMYNLPANLAQVSRHNFDWSYIQSGSKLLSFDQQHAHYLTTSQKNNFSCIVPSEVDF